MADEKAAQPWQEIPDESLREQISQLADKYANIGQDFSDYLKGLQESQGLHYWDYVHLEALLGLQNPRTVHPDEIIFITYHQITELYFKLIKLELDQLTDVERENPEYKQPEMWVRRIGRAVNYFKHLCSSFDIMLSGMDLQQFKRFRMALLPASGFQSVQYRHIEIMSTEVKHLVDPSVRTREDDRPEHAFKNIYWKRGGKEIEDGAKTLTLKHFEEKYDDHLLNMIEEYRYRNLYYLYLKAGVTVARDERIRELMRDYDRYVNVFWKLGHLGAAAYHLMRIGAGTGGTNWKDFLPPKFQRIIFFPKLWSEEEREEWGKAAVVKLFQEKVERSWYKVGEKER